MTRPMLLAGLVVLAACTAYAPVGPGAPVQAAAARGGGQCFYAPNVAGYRMGPNGTVIVHTNSRDYWELQTQAYCASRLDWENRMALRSRGGNWVCAGYDAELYVPDSLGSTYCPVYSVRKLSPAEVQAVRARR